MARRDVVAERIRLLGDNFGRYVGAYDERAPFGGEQLTTHRECIRLRREAGSVRVAVGDERFVRALRSTLKEWGIGARSSNLVPEARFAEALSAALLALRRSRAGRSTRHTSPTRSLVGSGW